MPRSPCPRWKESHIPNPEYVQAVALARDLLLAAREVETEVQGVVQLTLDLSMQIFRATTRSEAVPHASRLVVARETLDVVGENLFSLADAADEMSDQPELWLDRSAALAPGADVGLEKTTEEQGALDVILNTVRVITMNAGVRLREISRMGELAATRVLHFAEFDLVKSEANRLLAARAFAELDALAPKIRTLEKELASPRVSEVVDELTFQRLVAQYGQAGGDDTALRPEG